MTTSQPVAPLKRSRTCWRLNAALTTAVAAVAVAVAPSPATAAAPAPDPGVAAEVGGLRFAPTTPTRVADTRRSAPIRPGETRELALASPPGRPALPVAGASAAALNVTVINAPAAGHVRIAPGGSTTPPATSAVNFTAGETIANALTVKLSPSGTVAVYNASPAPVNVAVDVTGLYAAENVAPTGATYTPRAATRVYSSVAPAGRALAQPGQSTLVELPEEFAAADAVTYTITVVNPASAGHLRVGPPAKVAPETSIINFRAGDRIANSSVAAVAPIPGTSGRGIAVWNGSASPVGFIVDVTGTFHTGGDGLLYTAVDPMRVADTRFDTAGPLNSAGKMQTGETRVVGATKERGGARRALPHYADVVDTNLTVTGTGGAGHVRVWPGAQWQVPTETSRLNWASSGTARAAGGPVDVDVFGDAALYVSAPTHVAVDVYGYFAPRYPTLPPRTDLPDLGRPAGWAPVDTSWARWAIDGRKATVVGYTAPATADRPTVCAGLVDALRGWARAAGHTPAPPASVSIRDPLTEATTNTAAFTAKCANGLGDTFDPVGGLVVLPDGRTVQVRSARVGQVRTWAEFRGGFSTMWGPSPTVADRSDYLVTFSLTFQ